MWADSVNRTPLTSLLIGAISVQLGQQLMQQANDEKSCEKATRAGDLFTEAQIHLPRAAADQSNQATVAQLMTALQQLSSFPERQKQAFCKKQQQRLR